MDAVAWSVLAMASGSSSGISRNSPFHRVNVVLPDPLAPAMKVSLGRITSRKMRKMRISSAARREFLATVSSRWPPRRGRLRPSFVPVPQDSQPWIEDTPAPAVLDLLLMNLESTIWQRVGRETNPVLFSAEKWSTRPKRMRQCFAKLSWWHSCDEPREACGACEQAERLESMSTKEAFRNTCSSR
jgi:hypothetical protein